MTEAPNKTIKTPIKIFLEENTRRIAESDLSFFGDLLYCEEPLIAEGDRRCRTLYCFASFAEKFSSLKPCSI